MILVFGRNEEEHEARLEATLKRFEKAGITLNSEKCKFYQNQVKFLGHVIDKDGVHADQEKVKSVIDMKAPTNVSELCRFMWMVNQLAKFTPNLAELTQPLRELLSNYGVHADPEKVKSVIDMKALTNVSELRRFMGMVNQLAKFTLNLTVLTQPLNELLSKKNTSTIKRIIE